MSQSRLLFAFLFASLVFSPAFAQKKAFVVGISSYANVSKLPNTDNDADAIYKTLVKLGYNSTLIKGENTNKIEFLNSWASFIESTQSGDEVVFYYSGHGVEMDRHNYLIPRDVPHPSKFKKQKAFAGELISLYQLVSDLNEAGVQTSIWILDACRNNPFTEDGPTTKALLGSKGLVREETAKGTFFFYAAGENETALERLPSDPPTEKLSLYTRVISGHIDASGNNVGDIARKIRNKVKTLALTADEHKQVPAYYDALDDDWCFSTCKIEPNVEVAFNDGKVLDESTIVKNLSDSSKSLDDNLDDLQDLREGTEANAVFLGRGQDTAKCKSGSASDNYPFGCDVLLQAANKDQPNQSLTNKPLEVKTAVNVRYRIPSVMVPASSRCVVRTAQPGENIVMSAITEIKRTEDTYYWGIVAEGNTACPSMAESKAFNPLNVKNPDAKVLQYVDDLSSDDTATRRKARAQLGAFIATTKDDHIVSELVNALPGAPYRYQLGVAVALSAVNPKMLTTEVKQGLEKAASAKGGDDTLKKAFANTLKN